MSKNRTFIIISCIALLSSCGKKTEETKAVKKDVIEMVFAAGVLEANNTYNLTAQTEGYIRSVDFKEGDIVTAGEVLAIIDNRESIFNKESAVALFEISERNIQSNAPALAQAKANVQTAKLKFENDSIQAYRYKILFEKNTVSKTEFESIWLQYATSQNSYVSALENYKLINQQAQQQYISSNASRKVNQTYFGNNEVKIIVGGRVYKKLKQAGDYVRRGDAIATIGDAELLFAKVNVDEASISKIKTGQKCVIELNTKKNKIYNGVVSEILPAFDEETQSFVCKIKFIDSLDFKITGTQLQSNIIIGRDQNAMVIPRNYLNYDGTVEVKGKSQKVKLITGFVSKDYVQVLSGIDESETLVTENILTDKDKTSEFGAQFNK